MIDGLNLDVYEFCVQGLEEDRKMEDEIPEFLPLAWRKNLF